MSKCSEDIRIQRTIYVPPVDAPQAVQRFKVAADRGSASAQANLGVFYELGLGGLPNDHREAARLFKLAADQGDSSGRAGLASFYEEGRGGLPKDDCEAARLFKLAANGFDDWCSRGVANFCVAEGDVVYSYQARTFHGFHCESLAIAYSSPSSAASFKSRAAARSSFGRPPRPFA